MPYKGFGNENEVYLIGRVLRDRGIGISAIEDSRFRNFRKMYKRFMTWEIPNARIKATLDGNEWISTTNEEGYFEFEIMNHAFPKTDNSWREVKLELLDQIIPNQGVVQATAKVFIPTKLVEYGVISDIDDTIVPTGATRIWEMVKTTFLGNAHSRMPFPGVSAFYQALEKGTDGMENNPMFYVSSSPWNLYDFLMELLEVHKIPKGPLMLRDLGLSREHFFSGSHFDHKLSQVEKIFRLIPSIPFILIGDSGQHDAEIYLQVIKDYPGRVKMIYIRDVSENRRDHINEIASQISGLGVELVLIQDTIAAAKDALGKGWIRQEDVLDIIKEKTENSES
ncbi:App1 family protein [Belliella marina]|uniref:App1 family protein n=1 Tax=Belliella marina TaxID=1644146 RepID=A0ABW4VMP2_9BACT